MGAATAGGELGAKRRVKRFERECERLRPLGEAYVLRRFGRALGRADAEDVVAEVLIRLHRLNGEGRAPANLRPAFFTSVRNQAIDQLRSRATRPTAPLEAAADTAGDEPAPAEWAEGRESAALLQEALARMRGNYREAVLLRFGLGLTVPEMAEHLGISLPAAKKLVLRATRQVRQRLEAIEGRQFCPEMRELARRSVFEKRASGLASEAESEVLRAHFSHCGSCKSFLANLNGAMHDLGAAALFGLGGSETLVGRLGVLGRIAQWATKAVDVVQAGPNRVRHLTYKATGAFAGSDAGSAGALMGSGQKIAAICGTATAAATCLLTGAVGPGLGASATVSQPPAQVRTTAASAEPAEPAPAPVSNPAAEPTPAPATPKAPPPAQDNGESAPVSEFGLESGSASSSSRSSASPSAASRGAGESGGEFGSASSGGGSPSGAAHGGGAVGFQG